MADIKIYAKKLPTWEGGFVNDPLDNGGATETGITLNTFIGYRKLIHPNTIPPTINDLKNISPTEWLDVLQTIFWDKWQGNRINNQSVAESLVEWFWGSGWHGIKEPQLMLGLTSDGIVGPATIQAVNNQDPEQFHERLRLAKIDYINTIVKNNPSQQKFYNGWLRRINAFTFEL